MWSARCEYSKRMCFGLSTVLILIFIFRNYSNFYSNNLNIYSNKNTYLKNSYLNTNITIKNSNTTNLLHWLLEDLWSCQWDNRLRVRRMTLKVHASVYFNILAWYNNIITRSSSFFHLSNFFFEFSFSVLFSIMSFTSQVTLFRSQSRNFDVETRLQALTLIKHDIAIKIVQAVIEMIIRIISELKKKARSREYDSKISRMLKLDYVTNVSRLNRFSKIILIVETIILINVRVDKNERKKCFARLSYEHEISSITILRVLKRNEFRSCKSIMKLDLNAIMMKTRLQFCLRHKNWIIDDWKNVIWSDETSVILSFRRSRRLQWRTFKEKHVKTCIRRRWKNVSEFLFWDCYSYDKKESFHIWEAETAIEKRAAQREIDQLNVSGSYLLTLITKIRD
jgi:hypothetical protein